jgi:trigger factor
MMEIVRDKAKTVVGDAAKVTDGEGNAVDLKAVYAELDTEQAAEQATEQEEPAEA